MCTYARTRFRVSFAKVCPTSGDPSPRKTLSENLKKPNRSCAIRVRHAARLCTFYSFCVRNGRRTIAQRCDDGGEFSCAHPAALTSNAGRIQARNAPSTRRSSKSSCANRAKRDDHCGRQDILRSVSQSTQSSYYETVSRERARLQSEKAVLQAAVQRH